MYTHLVRYNKYCVLIYILDNLILSSDVLTDFIHRSKTLLKEQAKVREDVHSSCRKYLVHIMDRKTKSGSKKFAVDRKIFPDVEKLPTIADVYSPS